MTTKSDTRIPDADDPFILHSVCRSNSSQEIKNILANNPDFCRIPDHRGRYPLHYACWNFNDLDPDVLEGLLAAFPEAAVLPEAEHGLLPLHFAYGNQYTRAWTDETKQDAKKGEDGKLEIARQTARLEKLRRLIDAHPKPLEKLFHDIHEKTKMEKESEDVSIQAELSQDSNDDSTMYGESDIKSKKARNRRKSLKARKSKQSPTSKIRATSEAQETEEIMAQSPENGERKASAARLEEIELKIQQLEGELRFSRKKEEEMRGKANEYKVELKVLRKEFETQSSAIRQAEKQAKKLQSVDMDRRRLEAALEAAEQRLSRDRTEKHRLQTSEKELSGLKTSDVIEQRLRQKLAYVQADLERWRRKVDAQDKIMKEVEAEAKTVMGVKVEVKDMGRTLRLLQEQVQQARDAKEKQKAELDELQGKFEAQSETLRIAESAVTMGRGTKDECLRLERELRAVQETEQQLLEAAMDRKVEVERLRKETSVQAEVLRNAELEINKSQKEAILRRRAEEELRSAHELKRQIRKKSHETEIKLAKMTRELEMKEQILKSAEAEVNKGQKEGLLRRRIESELKGLKESEVKLSQMLKESEDNVAKLKATTSLQVQARIKAETEAREQHIQDGFAIKRLQVDLKAAQQIEKQIRKKVQEVGVELKIAKTELKEKEQILKSSEVEINECRKEGALRRKLEGELKILKNSNRKNEKLLVDAEEEISRLAAENINMTEAKKKIENELNERQGREETERKRLELELNTSRKNEAETREVATIRATEVVMLREAVDVKTKELEETQGKATKQLQEQGESLKKANLELEELRKVQVHTALLVEHEVKFKKQEMEKRLAAEAAVKAAQDLAEALQKAFAHKLANERARLSGELQKARERAQNEAFMRKQALDEVEKLRKLDAERSKSEDIVRNDLEGEVSKLRAEIKRRRRRTTLYLRPPVIEVANSLVHRTMNKEIEKRGLGDWNLSPDYAEEEIVFERTNMPVSNEEVKAGSTKEIIANIPKKTRRKSNGKKKTGRKRDHSSSNFDQSSHPQASVEGRSDPPGSLKKNPTTNPSSPIKLAERSKRGVREKVETLKAIEDTIHSVRERRQALQEGRPTPQSVVNAEKLREREYIDIIDKKNRHAKEKLQGMRRRGAFMEAQKTILEIADLLVHEGGARQ